MRDPEKASIWTPKPSPPKGQQAPIPRYPMLILQENRNTILHTSRQAVQSHTEPIDTPKPVTGHGTTHQTDEVQLHQPEHRQKSPQPGNLYMALVQPHSWGTDSTTKNNDLETFTFFKNHNLHFHYILLPLHWPSVVLWIFFFLYEFFVFLLFDCFF